ncbi:hypothetical protein BCV72DRAFT_330492 [Rhizopus microsporus var. microsporus]|nr:hypothetical protein BCV72DRAFT_330492 [Rhizopus microsporus var. microsporus]
MLCKALFSSDDPMAVPHSLDKAYSSGPATSRQPGYAVGIYNADGEQYKSVIGKVKQDKAVKHALKKDLYRIAVFTKDELCNKGLKGMLGFQAIGKVFRLSIPKEQLIGI